MAKIYPFRGIRYDPKKVGSLDSVVTRQVDRIDSHLQEEYHHRSDFNFVKLIKGKTNPDDTETRNQYTRAAHRLAEWLAEGILVRDEKPCMYVYHVEYALEKGPPRLRKGYIALAGLDECGPGIGPPEIVPPRPRQDSLHLMRATGAQFEQVFVLYPDRENAVQDILDKARTGEPDMQAHDDLGNLHRVWAISDPDVLRETRGLMEKKRLFISEGHHRCETSLEYRKEMLERGAKCEGNENFNNHPVVFVNFFDEGLTILPTHRVCCGVGDLEQKKFFQTAGNTFLIEEIPFGRYEDEGLSELLERMEKQKKRHSFGLYIKGEKIFHMLSLAREETVDDLVGPGHSKDWKRLDVTILHKILFEKILGIVPEQAEKEGAIRYVRGAAEAVHQVDTGKCELAFLLNPISAEQMERIAQAGERMPEKSVDFYPKILSSLVMNKLNFVR